MFKKFTVILVLLTLVFSVMPVDAASMGHEGMGYCKTFTVQKPVIYKSIINVTERGGIYQVGFVTIKFPRNFIDKDQLPVRISVEISAVNGEPGISFTPDIPEFNRKVTIYVLPYYGPLYDSAAGKNIWVRVRQKKYDVGHFSRYAFS